MSAFSRRKFLKNSTLAGVGISLAGALKQETTLAATQISGKTPFKSKINIGVIGVGLRGRDHVELLLDREDCNVIAIADPDPMAIEETKKLCSTKGKKEPKSFGNGDYDYRNLLEMKELDAVLIASPWMWHSEQAIAAMKAGKYVGTEVCGAFSIDECWQLVNTHEATGTHLYFMENVCFRRDVMAVLNMVRQGLFGEMLHLECGYQHDLRHVKFNDGKQPYGGGVEFGEKGLSEAKWRTIQSVHRNGDLYPTHGTGPVSQYIGNNRGNRFLHLTSTSSKARGLHNYIVNHPKGGKDHPNASVEFKLGDIVTTVIKCVNGETIIVSHDTSSPRPYSLGFRVQGTKGLWMDVNKSLYIEGVSPNERWESTSEYFKKYDHPLWLKHAHKAEGAGHGGMDWFLIHSFVEHCKLNQAPPFDVYDAASWLAITPLSEQSIATGSAPVAFPDFTRGRWVTKKDTFAFGDSF